jgi:hypothetical protein
MLWNIRWTDELWGRIRWRSGAIQDLLRGAVRAFAGGDTSNFFPDGPGSNSGRIIVGVYRIGVQRAERHSFTNEDGEEQVDLDVIVVLSVVAVDPDGDGAG